jgi:hypothetical protein
LSADIPLAVELIDMQGRKLFISDPKTFHQISMGEFPEGMYVVRISDGEKVSYRKIVKAAQ